MKRAVTPANVAEVIGRVGQGVAVIADDPALMKLWVGCSGVRETVGRALARGPAMLTALLDGHQPQPYEILRLKYRLLLDQGRTKEELLNELADECDVYVNCTRQNVLDALRAVSVPVALSSNCHWADFQRLAAVSNGSLRLTPALIRQQLAATHTMSFDQHEQWCADQGLKMISVEQLLQLLLDLSIADQFEGRHPMAFVNHFVGLDDRTMHIRCRNCDPSEPDDCATSLVVEISATTAREDLGDEFTATIYVNQLRQSFRHHNHCTLAVPF